MVEVQNALPQARKYTLGQYQLLTVSENIRKIPGIRSGKGRTEESIQRELETSSTERTVKKIVFDTTVSSVMPNVSSKRSYTQIRRSSSSKVFS